jgi:hypothetical protein
VVSTPAGAKILLNGSDTNKVTPDNISFTGKSSRTVELQLKGYQPINQAITDADLKNGFKEFTFEREAIPVKLTITGSFPFEVYQGGKQLSAPAMSHSVTAQPGAGPVTVQNAEYFLQSTLKVDYQRSSQDLTLPAPGQLAVFAQMETCKVVVDGQDLGNPPVPARRIAAGNHTVTLKCPDSKDDSRKAVTVSPGEKAQVTFSGSGGE